LSPGTRGSYSAPDALPPPPRRRGRRSSTAAPLPARGRILLLSTRAPRKLLPTPTPPGGPVRPRRSGELCPGARGSGEVLVRRASSSSSPAGQPGHISTENRKPNRTETEPNSRFFGFSVRFQFLLSDSSVIGVGFGSCVEPNRTTEVCIVGCLNRRKPETIADALPSILRPN